MSLFGTDGVRGRAGEVVLAAVEASRLVCCFGLALVEGGAAGRVALARDTRESGEMLSNACARGLRAAGLQVVDLGVLPTPGLSWWLAEQGDLAGGVMITASHNPWHDNGLKFFAADGGKVSDELQERCALFYGQGRGGCVDELDVVEVEDRHREASSGYLESLSVVGKDPTPLAGRKVVADTASGAAWAVLPAALAALGAEVVSCAPDPDGRNINEGWGAVVPAAMASVVVAQQAWAGVAVDGDGDRVMIADEKGQVHDGDAVVGFLAGEMQRSGTLRGDRVVGTVTTNGGLEQFLRSCGLELLRTPVGDRHISAAMRQHQLNLGGESSGHILTPDLCPSGDGTRVALLVLSLAAAVGGAISEQLVRIPRFPVANRKVPFSSRPPLESLVELQAAVRSCESTLTTCSGRLLLRYSGTEPLLRVLVEGSDPAIVEHCADELASAAQRSFAVLRAAGPGVAQ
tara:strand:+ start:1136 stop:2518 length:1383 start_codon:yes stop_codon:yes gene_type:complete